MKTLKVSWKRKLYEFSLRSINFFFFRCNLYLSLTGINFIEISSFPRFMSEIISYHVFPVLWCFPLCCIYQLIQLLKFIGWITCWCFFLCVFIWSILVVIQLPCYSDWLGITYGRNLGCNDIWTWSVNSIDLKTSRRKEVIYEVNDSEGDTLENICLIIQTCVYLEVTVAADEQALE